MTISLTVSKMMSKMPHVSFGRISQHYESIPEPVAEYYAESVRTRSVSGNSFAVNVRRALEAICDDRTIPDGNLNNWLRSLAFKEELPPLLLQLTDVVRSVSNLGSHAKARNVSHEECRLLDRLFKLIVDYPYVIPSELASYRLTLKQEAPSDLENREKPEPRLQ
jgi:hypothetical protein